MIDGVESAAIGDCMLWDRTANHVASHTVSCAKPHLVEVTAVIDVSAEFTSWPGEAALQRVLEQRCPDALHHYAPGRPADPVLVGNGIVPLQAAWSDGDQRIVCTVESPFQRLVTGSVKSAAPVVVAAS
jgi:hypothetical protein